MDAKGLDFLNITPALVTNIKLSQKSGPVIKPVESIKKTSENGTAFDARKQEDNNQITWLPVSQKEEDARLATEILAHSLADSPDLEVDWRYDQDKGILLVEVKNKNTGEVVRQMPPEDILSTWKKSDSDDGIALLNGIV